GEVRAGGEFPPRVALGGPSSAGTPEITVVWTAGGETTAIRSARSRDGGRTFGPPATLQAPGAPGNRGWPSLAVDGSGKAHAVWLDHRGLAAEGAADHRGPHDGVAMAQKSALLYAPAAG